MNVKLITEDRLLIWKAAGGAWESLCWELMHGKGLKSSGKVKDEGDLL